MQAVAFAALPEDLPQLFGERTFGGMNVDRPTNLRRDCAERQGDQDAENDAADFAQELAPFGKLSCIRVHCRPRLASTSRYD